MIMYVLRVINYDTLGLYAVVSIRTTDPTRHSRSLLRRISSIVAYNSFRFKYVVQIKTLRQSI